jgi:hypothetical protein
MPSLSGVIKPELIEYTVPLGSESATIIFDSSKVTMRWEHKVDQAQKEDDNIRRAEAFAEVFVSWDVVDDSGVVVPMTADLLLDLPAKVLNTLIKGMSSASVPSSEEGNGSATISSTPQSVSSLMPASPQNGPSPSTLPEPSASQLST